MEPFLEQEAFKKQQRRIGVSAFARQSYSIVAHENIFNTVPINLFIEFLHVFYAAIMFFWAFKDHVGKAEFLVHFFKTHTILQLIVFLGKYDTCYI